MTRPKPDFLAYLVAIGRGLSIEAQGTIRPLPLDNAPPTLRRDASAAGRSQDDEDQLLIEKVFHRAISAPSFALRLGKAMAALADINKAFAGAQHKHRSSRLVGRSEKWDIWSMAFLLFVYETHRRRGKAHGAACEAIATGGAFGKLSARTVANRVTKVQKLAAHHLEIDVLDPE